MKNILSFIIVAFFFANASYAQKQTLFIDKDYKTVLQEAKTNKKPIVIMFYATWCAHCNKMKNDVFIDPNVINFYKNTFNCMAVDAESPIGIELKTKFQDKFKIRSYPTFAFFDSNENLLYAIAGEFTADKFIAEGQNVLLPENQFLNIKNKFEADVSNPDNCLKYIVILRKAGFDSTPVTETYLKTLNKKERFTELNWRIVANGINDFNSDEFLFIIKNKEAYSAVSSPARVDKKIVSLMNENFKNDYEKADAVSYNNKKAIAETFQIRKVDSLIFNYDMLFTSDAKDWKNYQKVTEANVEKFASKNANLLTEICTNYLNYIDDKKGLQNAVNWSYQSLEISPSLDKYILTAKLLKKLKEYKQALETAEKGKALAESYGWKTEEIEKLITEIKSID